MPFALITKSLKTFRRDEDGAFSVLSIYFLMGAIVLSGIAIDFANWEAKRSRLQAAADSVAHAALYLRETQDAATAIEGALELAYSNLPPALHGDALKSNDIEFGVWDAENGTFTPDANAYDAVRVTAVRSAARENGIKNLMLRIIGTDAFEASTPSIYAKYQPKCFEQGFVAGRHVDMQSNNRFENGFCIHANNSIKVSSGNFFEAGTVVSLPKLSSVEMPNSGFESNDGFEAALKSSAYRMRLLAKMDGILDDMWNGGVEYAPDYINGTGIVTLSVKNNRLEPGDFVPGRMHRYECTGKGRITFVAGTYSSFGLVTNCSIRFNNGVVLEDTMIGTNLFNGSISAPQGLQIGRDDNCAPGGGSILMTKGTFDVSANLEAYGGQILASRDINFSANANGIQGVSMIAGRDVKGTSNMIMGFCDEGIEHFLQADYFRMVQ